MDYKIKKVTEVYAQRKINLIHYSNLKQLKNLSIREDQDRFFFTMIEDNIFLGPYVKSGSRGCPNCVIETIRFYNKNLDLPIMLLTNPDIEITNEIFNEELIEKTLLESLDNIEVFENFTQLLNLYSFKFSRYKMIENEYCKVCSNLELDSALNLSAEEILTSKNKKLGKKIYRTKQLSAVSNLLEDWKDQDSGIFIHKYTDFRSTFMNATGVEVQGFENFIVTGYGRSVNNKDNENIAVLEALERYAGLSNRVTKTDVFGSYNSLKEKIQIINPTKFSLPPVQKNKEFIQYHENLPIYWKKGVSLITNNVAYIPEQLVYFGNPASKFGYKKVEEKRFVYDTSNGLALGGTPSEAIFHGLLELIERDSFLNMWYSASDVRRIDVTGIDLEINQILQYLKDKKIDIHFFQANKDVKIPCVVALIVDNNDNATMKYYLAASANPDLKKAIDNAALEVITSLPIFKGLIEDNVTFRERREWLLKNPKRVSNQDDHILFSSGSNADSIYLSLIKKSSVIKFEDVAISDLYHNEFIEEDLVNFIGELKDIFEDVIVIDVTPAKIREKGFYIYKSIIIGAQPMYFGVQNERVDIDRIKNYTEGKILDRVNKLPHPFP